MIYHRAPLGQATSSCGELGRGTQYELKGSLPRDEWWRSRISEPRHRVAERGEQRDENRQKFREAEAHDYRIGVLTKIRRYCPQRYNGLDAVGRRSTGEHTVDGMAYPAPRRSDALSGSYGYGEHHQETAFYIDSVQSDQST
ncbi:MAG: hypothetical protein J2P47_03365 [Acetobacteraceae bacterium]|nr:hypothetical protein [Acetobacteraceae bacterium]